MKTSKLFLLGILIVAVFMAAQSFAYELTCVNNHDIGIAHPGETITWTVGVETPPSWTETNLIDYILLELPCPGEIVPLVPPNPLVVIAPGERETWDIPWVVDVNCLTFTYVASLDEMRYVATNFIEASGLDTTEPIPGVPQCSGVDSVIIFQPKIEVTKTVNREWSKVGDPVTYTIKICNVGDADLTLTEITDTILPIDIQWLQDNHPECIELSAAVYDMNGVLIPDSGECCEFTYDYIIQESDLDPLENEVCVTAIDVTGFDVNDCDTAVVDLVKAGIDLKKNCPDFSKIGDETCYELILTNEGEVPVQIIDAFDTNYGPILDWIGEVIDPNEVWTFPYCIIIPPDAPNPFPNDAFVFGTVIELGNPVEDANSCDVPLVDPQIDIEKTVDPNEACPGDTVTYTICIENVGDHNLVDVEVYDPILSPDPLPGFPTELEPGERVCLPFDYTIPPDANVPYCGEGWFTNCAFVLSRAEGLPNLREDEDCAEICCPDTPGGEGCTPGFWKNNGDKHGASAWCDRFEPGDPISMHFDLDETLVIRGRGRSTITDPTLLQALNANGGGVNAMIRHGIAAMLNACSDCVQYEYSSPDQVIAWIEGALNGDGPYTVGELHSMFAEANEAGCPVNQHGECVGVEEEMDG